MYTHHKVDHEYPGDTETHVSYMVCSVPRCGSSLLCELLCNTGVAGAPTEFFDPELMGRFRERWGTSSDDAYIDQLLRRKTGPNGVFGVKAHWDQVRDGMPDGPAALFPNLHHIYMRRADTLRQAVSWVRAIQTNQWASSHDARAEPVFDRAGIAFYVEAIRKQDAAWERYFTERAIRPHVVTYEALVDAPDDTVREVLEFLGVPGPHPTASGPIELERQADALTEEWVERYASYT